MMAKFSAAGDEKSAQLLEIIFEDEKTHVGAGSVWFTHLCNAEKLDAESCFKQKLADYFTGLLKPPFNIEARTQAGIPLSFYKAPPQNQ